MPMRSDEEEENMQQFNRRSESQEIDFRATGSGGSNATNLLGGLQLEAPGKG